MRNPFKKKSKQQDLQQIQTEFNQVIFELGDLSYRKTMIGRELSKINERINSLNAKADQYGKDALKAREKIQEEMAKVAQQPGAPTAPEAPPEGIANE